MEAGLNIALCEYYYDASVDSVLNFELEFTAEENVYAISDILNALTSASTTMTTFYNNIDQSGTHRILYIDIFDHERNGDLISLKVRGVLGKLGNAFQDPTPSDEIYFRSWPNYFTYASSGLRGYCSDHTAGKRISNPSNSNPGYMTQYGRYAYMLYGNLLPNNTVPPVVFVDIDDHEVLHTYANDNTYRPGMNLDMYEGYTANVCFGTNELSYYMTKSNPKISNLLSTINKSYIDHWWTHNYLLKPNDPDPSAIDASYIEDVIILSSGILINEQDIQAFPLPF